KIFIVCLILTVAILPSLMLSVAVFVSTARSFSPEANLLNFTPLASINIVLSSGMTFIILTGGIALFFGSILGTTSVAALVVSL
ncbi:ribose ABC transporter permease, partial [Klebsiella pneumoniae]|nr:ribose ABC transporter permease [Klebsiella pneumoniae]